MTLTDQLESLSSTYDLTVTLPMLKLQEIQEKLIRINDTVFQDLCDAFLFYTEAQIRSHTSAVFFKTLQHDQPGRSLSIAA